MTCHKSCRHQCWNLLKLNELSEGGEMMPCCLICKCHIWVAPSMAIRPPMPPRLNGLHPLNLLQLQHLLPFILPHAPWIAPSYWHQIILSWKASKPCCHMLELTHPSTSSSLGHKSPLSITSLSQCRAVGCCSTPHRNHTLRIQNSNQLQKWRILTINKPKVVEYYIIHSLFLLMPYLVKVWGGYRPLTGNPKTSRKYKRPSLQPPLWEISAKGMYIIESTNSENAALWVYKVKVVQLCLALNYQLATHSGLTTVAMISWLTLIPL